MNTGSDTRDDRMTWFRDARFGMFVHWGCYSVLGRGEQIMSRDMMPLDEYLPIADRFNPKQDWAPRLAERARKAGARYVVLTTRHHDGYCLFNTSTHDFNAVKTGPGRDLIAEYVGALREAGLKVGLYYSVHTWRHHGFWDPAGYPEDLPRIVDEMHTQVRELMTNYGEIDFLWYDSPGVPGSTTPGSSTYTGTAVEQSSAEFYRSAQLNAAVRELQPHILINNRSGLPEDYGTPEQRIRPEEEGRMWEACMTINYAPNWGYLNQSMADKSAGEVLYNLVSAVRLGGNYLFNVGPNGDGYIDDREGDVLDAIGQWMERNGEAIYGTRPEGIYRVPNQGPCYHYGMFTCKGSTAYMTLFYYPGDPLIISRVGPAIRSAELLTTGENLKIEPMSNARWRIKGLPQRSPDPVASVVKIEFEAPPYALTYNDAKWLDGQFTGEQ